MYMLMLSVLNFLIFQCYFDLNLIAYCMPIYKGFIQSAGYPPVHLLKP